MKSQSPPVLGIWAAMAGVIIFATCLMSPLCQGQEKKPIVQAQHESIKPEIVLKNTKLLAWKLGTNLGWTFALRLNYPPQFEDKVFQSLEKTRFIAKTLGLRDLTWPEKRGARSPNNDAIIKYLAELAGTKSADAITPQLVRKYGDEHAFYFNIAMQSMSAFIFYAPGSPDNANLIEDLEKLEKASREASGDPNFQSAWKPVIDAIKQSLPPDVVLTRIQEMDNKISHNLANDVRN